MSKTDTAPKVDRVPKKVYETEMLRLQTELVALQQGVTSDDSLVPLGVAADLVMLGEPDIEDAARLLLAR